MKRTSLGAAFTVFKSFVRRTNTSLLIKRGLFKIALLILQEHSNKDVFKDKKKCIVDS